MKGNKFLITCLIILFFVITNTSFAAYDVLVAGNKRIESATIKSFFQNININDQKQINDSIKRLHRTGIFANIKVEKDGEILNVDITENPLVNDIHFIGNKKLSSDLLLDELRLAPRSVYTKQVLQSDAQRIVEIYKRSGRIDVEVKPKVMFLEENRIDVIFVISENEKVKIKKYFLLIIIRIRKKSYRKLL